MKTRCPDCCHSHLFHDRACGCCEGVESTTPQPTANRPGLSQLRYRIGTHASFLETMQARLSNHALPALAGLTTRDANDPSFALCDAWSIIADVLTFYQERIANEGYLLTATERRSILELGRLVGYRLQPGVAASVFLAYTLDAKMSEEVTIPAGSRVQSIPGPDELPQSFETSEDLKARAKWNNLKPRMTKPQTANTILNGSPDGAVPGPRLYLKGVTTQLKSNDPLLIGIGGGDPDLYRVSAVIEDADADRTLVIFRSPDEPILDPEDPPSIIANQMKLIEQLTLRPSLNPRNALQLRRNLKEQFSTNAEAGYQSVGRFNAQLKETLSTAVKNAQVSLTSKVKVYALRVQASLFGHNALREPQYEPVTIVEPGSEFPTPNPLAGNLRPQPWDEWHPDGEADDVLHLDRRYDQILPGSPVVVHISPDESPEVYESDSVEHISRSVYGMSGETTRIKLADTWWEDFDVEGDISVLRTAKVFAQPELLELAEEPIETVVCGGTDSPLELDGFYDGLESGRWVIVSGERDISGTSGVRFSELAMLASVTHEVSTELGEPTDPGSKLARDGEKIHTYIKLAEKLQYCFKRDTITIYGNVAKATHGETRRELLGSGDGSKALQSFELKQAPLTYVSASNPTGVDNTLKLIVNDLQWYEADSLVGLEATDRNFITRTDNEDKTTIIFGNGIQGARLPTGVENVKAHYRNGIGRLGNVTAEQISLLISKPLGVKEVINPLRASGGADRESRDRARNNTPLAVKALDRLVSVQDYEDFARVYAGIGKASAVEIHAGRRQLVHVTIAGADDIPIDENADLFLNLRQALHDFGDPFQTIRLEVRELMMIVISAGVRLLPDYQWEAVVARLRGSLLDAFSFESRELGQDVLLSEVISVMQAVKGVAFVDVDTFGGIPEKIDDNGARRLLTPEEVSEVVSCLSTRWSQDDMDAWCMGETGDPECDKYFVCKEKYGTIGDQSGVRHRLKVNLAGHTGHAMQPAQLAILTPDLPDTLILNRIE